jgi:hypothetical protein
MWALDLSIIDGAVSNDRFTPGEFSILISSLLLVEGRHQLNLVDSLHINMASWIGRFPSLRITNSQEYQEYQE